MNTTNLASQQKITYWQAIKGFSKNAKLFLIYSTLSGVNSAIFLVAFAFYLEEIFRDGATILGAKLGAFAFIGLALSAQALAHGLNAVPSGFIGDKFGRRRSFILASLLALLSGALVLVTTHPLVLILLAVIVGIGEAFHGVVGAPFMMENSREEERIHLFSLSGMLSTFSSVVGALLGATLPSIFQGWISSLGPDALGPLGYGSERAIALRLALLMSVPFGLVELLPLAFMKESFATALTPLHEFFLLRHVRNKNTVGKLFLVSLAYSAGLGLYFPLLNLHFEHSFHIHEQEFGSIMALNNGAIVAAIFAVPLLVARLGKVRAIVFTRLLATPFLFALAFTPSLFLASLFFILRGALANMAFPVIEQLSMEVVEESERATTAGFTHMAFDVFYGAVISAGGILLSIGGFWLAFIAGGSLYVSQAVMWWLFFHNHPVNNPSRQ